MKKPHDVALSFSSGCEIAERSVAAHLVAVEASRPVAVGFLEAVVDFRAHLAVEIEVEALLQSHRLAETLADVEADNHGHA